MAAPTWEELYNVAKAEALSRRSDLTYDDGDVSDILTAGISAIGDTLVGYAASRFRATYLDSAKGDELTVLADDHWNVQREEATEAIGTVTFNRVSAAEGAGTIDAGTVVATTKDAQGNELQFTTDADVTYGALETGDKDVTVTAILTGKGGNVAEDTVVRIVTEIFDDTITVTNAERMAGGDEEESDEDLRERVRSVPRTIRRGTLAALEFGALQVTVVKRATVVEELDSEDELTGIVNIYVTDADGNSNQAMIDLVEAELENWRCAGIIVNVYGGELYTLTPITISLSVRASVSIPAIVSNVKAAIVSRIAKLKIGESCSPTIIKQAAANVDPDGILEVTVTAPAATVVPSANQVIRTTTGDITVS